MIVINSCNLLAIFVLIEYANSAIGNWEGCDGRLERALDALRRDPNRRTVPPNEEESESGIVYQRELKSTPMEMIVSRISVKLPRDVRGRGFPWARVERCTYEPNNNSLKTRLLFDDLTVAGRVSLLPIDYRAPIPAETCRMTLRLRRAGIEFFTSPIARGQGQMRIRTESSFLEPRFASIYAYGCRPTRGDKQIKRQDKWQSHSNQLDASLLPEAIVEEGPLEDYEAPEPRREEEPTNVAETRPRFDRIDPPGIRRRSDWITRGSRRRRRGTAQDITPRDFAMALAKEDRAFTLEDVDLSPTNTIRNVSRIVEFSSSSSSSRDNSTEMIPTSDPNGRRDRSVILVVDEKDETKASSERETAELPGVDVRPNEESTRPRQLLLEEDVEARTWTTANREGITGEMEDVFLRGASQALASYIERQLHPAIKETLMLSMGYTISYG